MSKPGSPMLISILCKAQTAWFKGSLLNLFPRFNFTFNRREALICCTFTHLLHHFPVHSCGFMAGDVNQFKSNEYSRE